MKPNTREIRRVVTVLVTTSLIARIISCWPTDDCSGGEEYRYSISGITGANVRPIEGKNLYDTLDGGESIADGQYALLVTPQTEKYVTENTVNLGSWLSTAYACEPAIIPMDMIRSIRIQSDANYILSTKTIAAGNTLDSLFDIGFAGYYDAPSSFKNLSEYNTELSSSEAYDYRFLLEINTAPILPQTHQFTVHYELTNGMVYRFTSNPITLLP